MCVRPGTNSASDSKDMTGFKEPPFLDLFSLLAKTDHLSISIFLSDITES
jgi:hypothetical protein